MRIILNCNLDSDSASVDVHSVCVNCISVMTIHVNMIFAAAIWSFTWSLNTDSIVDGLKMLATINS